MENQEKWFIYEIIRCVKSWISWCSSKRSDVSKEFWMPDHTCGVCYDCDAEFNLFVRRHHCRLCGRIFCYQCIKNSALGHVSFDQTLTPCIQEGETTKLCNFCIKQCNEENTHLQTCQTTSLPQNDFQISSSSFTPSSMNSLISTKSTFSANSRDANGIGCSLRYSTRSPCAWSSSYESDHSLGLAIISSESEDQYTSTTTASTNIMHSLSDINVSSSNQFHYCMNRSDDDIECDTDCYIPKVQYNDDQSNDSYNSDDYDDVDNDTCLHAITSTDESIDRKSSISSVNENPEYQTSINAEKILKVETDDANDGNPIFQDGTDSEFVDFENNGMLWLPPSPANAADKEVVSVDEEDDNEEEDVVDEEFSYAQSLISYDSSESQNKNQISEDHKISMKDVVVGHFKALVSQLLQVEDLPIGEEEEEVKDGWLDIITALSWEVATIFKPDTSNGGGMDIGGYAKIKCLASGHRSGSLVVSGIVFRKNLAHRRMKTKREKPCLLLLGGSLEYNRVLDHLSTFDNLLQKEKDHLKMAVGKIDAHHINVLLVEKTVSRLAQEYLLSKDISLVLNVKRNLLERISNCIDAPIVPSIDHLSSQNLGTCDLFHVDKFYEELNNTGRNQKSLMKNLMFFEGCPKPLGCTVLLMGASSAELKKVKHVLQYGIFAAYQLTLETSFLADEGAAISEFPTRSPITVALPEKPAVFGSSISTVPGFAATTLENISVENHVPSSNKILISTSDSMSCSITNTEMPLSSHTPYKVPDSQSMEKSSGFSYSFNDAKGHIENDFHTKKDIDIQPSGCFPPSFRKGSNCGDISTNNFFKETSNMAENFEKSLWKTSEHINGFTVPVCDNHFETTDAISEKKTAGNFFDPEFGNEFEDNCYTQEHELSNRDSLPAPSDHQSILVSLSTRCVWKGTVCERSHLFRIKYYGSFDKPLGRFLRDHLFDQYYQCHACEMPSEAHVHCYTHRQGRLAFSVKKISEVLAGEQDGKIWMWHSCLRCPREDGKPPRTLRVVMSDAAWGLSFGKFLELSFSNHASASRVASCGHSLHRDCLRFYGFGQMVACFRYVSINIHSVCLPPTELDFSPEIHDWMRQEVNEVIDKAELLFNEVLKYINQLLGMQINTNSNKKQLEVSESENYLIYLERMLHEERVEFEECLSNVIKKEKKEGHRFVDVFDINKLQRRLLFHSYLWDQRLIFATGLAINSRGRLSSMEKLVKSFVSQSAGMSTVNSPSSVTTRNDGNYPSFRSRNLYSQQSQQNLVYRNRLADHDYNKYRIDIRSCHSNTCSPRHQVNQSSGTTVHRSLSDGHVSQMSDLSDTLETKWDGENANTLTDFEELEENVGLDRDRSMIASETPKDSDIAVRNFCKWNEMSFLTAYNFIFMNVGFITPFLNIIFEYVPVHVSRFWELGDDRGDRLMFPIGINDTDIPVFDDEPSSIISYALITEEYNEKLAIQRDRPKDIWPSCASSPLHEFGKFHLFSFNEDSSQDHYRSTISIDDTPLPRTMSKNSLDSDQRFFSKAENINISFTYDGPLGKVIYTVTIYRAVHFDVLRKTCCPSELDYIRSLSRCKKWRAQGGKSNVFFAKSLDERFIFKQVTKTELDSFLQFSTKYFKYLCQSIGSRSPTCLAKILGIYQVMTKHLKSGKEIKMDLLVMENLLYKRNITRLYDLKGSSRSRYNADKTGSNNVLLDQNLIEAMPTSPIFVENKAKRLLERAVWNDTAFLASVDVMDYSLLLGVDGQSHELVLGIIDFMRQYTWDKHLETWVKTTGFLGGPKSAPPTVISPNQYKKRFRKAMSAYFVMVPDQLPSPSCMKPITSHSDSEEDSIQGFSPKT